MRILLGTVLPVVMITMCMFIQKTSHVGSTSQDPEPEHLEPSDLSPRLSPKVRNLALLNRSCAPPLLAHWEHERGAEVSVKTSDKRSGVRIIVGAGFVASGLNSLNGFMQNLPGACKPSRQSVGFWTSYSSATGSSARMHGGSATDSTVEDDVEGGGGFGAAVRGWGVGGSSSLGWGGGGGSSSALVQSKSLPPEKLTIERYLGSVGYRPSASARNGGCSVAWELTERYTSVGVRHYTPPAVCTPLSIRHHFPHARVLLMLADPVKRAHGQQTVWLHNRCFRDSREAASAARGGRGRLAKSAAPGCERMDASSQLRLELTCVRGCRLQPDSAVDALQQCATTCGRALRAALACKTNCPYLSLLNSHYSIILPLWMRAINCDQLLLLDRSLFDQPAAHGAGKGGDSGGGGEGGGTDAARSNRRARLRQRQGGTPAPPPPPLPPPPPPPPRPRPTPTSTPLLSMLKFVGVAADNATHIAMLQNRYRLAAPSFGTSSNPLDPQLQAELEAYFKPFQAQLKKMLSAHRKCFAERTKQAQRRKSGMQKTALARAG